MSGRTSCDLPESTDVEAIERVVITDDSHVFHLALCDEHTVERIAMLSGQTPGPLRVKQRDVQRHEALIGDTSRDIRRDVRGARQLPEARLRCDLPG